MANKRGAAPKDSTPAGITPEEFSTWLVPREALDSVLHVTNAETANKAILRRLQGELVKAVAEQSKSEIPFSAPTIRRFFEIPGPYWDHLTSEDFWNSGDVDFRLNSFHHLNFREEIVRCFNVRFEPRGIRELIDGLPKKAVPSSPISSAPKPAKSAARSAEQTTAVSASPNRGGRPKYDYWDDLWTEMCRQIYAGDLNHKKQANIEKAMLDWAAKHRHNMSEPSARLRARKLFAALEKEDKNRG
ncbi:MAG TPA: hypothetical protein VIJ62_12760 [Rhizomicrobium sp.]